MPAPTWMTATGVAGAVVIGGAALMAVAATNPSTEPTADAVTTAVASPSTSASPSSAVASPSASASTTVSTDGMPDETISAERAVQMAAGHLATVGDFVVEEIDLKPEDGRMIWDVDFVGDHEVEIDAVTGAILKVEIGGREQEHDGGGTDDRRGDDGGDDRDDHGDDHDGHDSESDGGNHGRG